MPTKQKREIIKFVSNTPVELTLDSDPSTAKSTTRESQWGPKVSYTYFTKDKVMFPSQALHDKLKEYSKGDTVTVNLVDGKIWQVTSNHAGARKEVDLNKLVNDTEVTILLRKIALDIDLIKSHLFGTNVAKDEPSDDSEEIDF